jgi:site-specific recombinase XerD
MSKRNGNLLDSERQRRFHFKDSVPTHPAVKRWSEWSPANREFYAQFREWLKVGGYQFSAVHTYGAAARLALGLLAKPYWIIDPQADIQTVREHLAERDLVAETKRLYNNGLDKFAEFICLRCRKPRPEKVVNWTYYIGSLPDWLAELVRQFVRHMIRTRRPEEHFQAQLEMLRSMTAPLRWMAAHGPLTNPASLTPELWYAYLEAELARGIKPVTLNGLLRQLRQLLTFAEENGQPICRRMRLIKPLTEARRMPKDAPVEQVQALWAAIELAAQSPHRLLRRYGLMDRAWFLLMLHSGLRSGEVRRLKFGDLDFEAKRLRIEQSKGLKDRLVPLTAATISALQDYLAVRGPKEALPPNVFIARHEPLSKRYFQIRLKNHGKQAGIAITPHQLRHTCATLLLNGGAPILVVQTVLGHRQVNTTLGYARLYDGTVAADYYRAMDQVEKRLPLIADTVLLRKVESQPNAGKLLALVDSLRSGTLNESQAEKLQLLRAGILALAERNEV